MKKSVYQRKLDKIEKDVFNKIMVDIFNRYQKKGELSLGEGIDYDYGEYDLKMITLKKNREIICLEDDIVLDLCDFNVIQLVRFLEELCEIYENN